MIDFAFDWLQLPMNECYRTHKRILNLNIKYLSKDFKRLKEVPYFPTTELLATWATFFNLGNFSTILRSNITKSQIFLKHRFHSKWRSYLVLTSGQKPKKLLEPFLRKVSDFGLIWRPFREYLQINNFYQKSGSVTLLPL